MKNSIIITAIALALAVTSCVEVPELSPERTSSDNGNSYTEEAPLPDFLPHLPSYVNLTHFNVTDNFSPTNHFSQPLDIDQNGTVDFWLMAKTYDMGESVVNHAVVLVGQGPRSKVIFEAQDLDLCNGSDISPIKNVDRYEDIDGNDPWYSSAVIYVMNETEDCTSHARFNEFNQYEYYGLRFEIDGQDHYGWIEIKSSGPSRIGYPDCGSSWTIKRAAYNSNSSQAMRVQY